MTGDRPAVVFLPGQAAALAQHMRVARAIAAEGRHQPVVFVPGAWPNEPADGADGVRIVQLHGGGPVQRVGLEVDLATAEKRAAATRTLRGRLLRESLFAVQLRARRRARALTARAAGLSERLRDAGARALVVADDRRQGVTLALLRAARDLGLGSVLVPSAHAHPVGSAGIRVDHPIHAVDGPPMQSAKAHVARRHPGQVYEHEGRRLLFYGPVGTLALARAGQLPDNPWWPGGGLVDRVCVFSDRARDERIAAGIAAERLDVTGDVATDEVHAASRERDTLRPRIVADSGLPADRPLVVLAIPQLAEQGVLPWPQHREEMADLARRTAAGGAAVAVSLHPKTRREDYAFLEEIAAVRIVDVPLVRLLPTADLFVAARSSTVAWAIALGIPPLLADFGWLGHRTWEDVEGVTVTTERPAYDAALRGLLTDPAVHETARASLAREAASRTLFDGRATERTLAVIERAAREGALSRDGTQGAG